MSVTRGNLEIDLQAVIENIKQIHRSVGPSKICAVVKANAYGHGAIPMAKTFIKGGVSYLAVACVQEGIELRQANITCPILLLSQPETDEVKEALYFGLIPTVYRKDILHVLKKYSKIWKQSLNKRLKASKVAVHIKIDTGMHRLGVSPNSFFELLDEIHSIPELNFAGLWTHFACADDPANKLTGMQFNQFMSLVNKVPRSNKILKHVANTAAMLQSRKFNLDMVRIGIGLYGYYPSKVLCGSSRVKLKPVASLSSYICHLVDINKNEGVSYGHSYVAKRPTRLAVIPLGYADGIPRRLGQYGGKVLINNQTYPVVGNVTMDYTIVDVGHGTNVNLGDKVYFVYKDHPTASFNFWAINEQAIVYEMLTSIGNRVLRKYE